MSGRRSARQADDDDEDMQPVVRMPQRDQISKQNLTATTSPKRHPVVKKPMAAIPSMGGPELMMDDDDDDDHLRKERSKHISSEASGLKRGDDGTPPSPGRASASGSSVGSPQRQRQQQQRDRELKKQAASKPGAVRPGAVAVAGVGATPMASSSGSVMSSETRNSNSSGLELAPGVEGEGKERLQRQTATTTDAEIKRAAASGRDTTSPKKTGAAALLTDEEMKAAAVATSRAYAQQQQPQNNMDDSKRKAHAVPGQKPAPPSYPTAAAGPAHSQSPTQSRQNNNDTPPDVYMVPDNHYEPPIMPGTATFTSHASLVSEAASQKKENDADANVDAMESQPTIVAELAPDEDVMAERIAERVREEMAQKYGKLEEERSQQTSTAPPVVAVKLEEVDSKVATPGRQDNDKNKNNEDDWVFCGFSKACVIWTTAAVVLVIIGGVIGAIFGAGLIGGDDTSPTVETTPSPTSSPLIGSSPGPTKQPPTNPPTLSPTNLPTITPESERFELLWDLIGADIAEDPMALRNPETPQYQALDWIANQDPASYQISDAFATSLKERYAILVLVFQNGRASNLESLGFMSALPVCGWYDAFQEKGIECNGPWVSAIRLRDSNLQGPIPSEIGLLRSLGALDIDENFFLGTFPIGLSTLSNLYLFWALNNGLTGSLPTEVGLMTSLTTFDVGQNAMTGSIPTEMGTNPSMLEMYYYENRFNGTLPTEFGTLQRMIYLSARNNEMTGTIPTEYGGMASMVTLALDNNLLTGTLPTELGRLVDMEAFFVYQNQLDGTVPTEFASLTKLTQLELNYNSLTGTLDPMFCDTPRMQPWDSFYADCRDGEIGCSCCTHCCTDTSCSQTLGGIILP